MTSRSKIFKNNKGDIILKFYDRTNILRKITLCKNKKRQNLIIGKIYLN